MGIIGIIGLILDALKYLPQLWKILKELIALFRQLKGRPGFDAKEVLTELKDGLRAAKENKDVSKLEALHKKLSDLCVSNGV